MRAPDRRTPKKSRREAAFLLPLLLAPSAGRPVRDARVTIGFYRADKVVNLPTDVVTLEHALRIDTGDLSEFAMRMPSFLVRSLLCCLCASLSAHAAIAASSAMDLKLSSDVRLMRTHKKNPMQPDAYTQARLASKKTRVTTPAARSTAGSLAGLLLAAGAVATTHSTGIVTPSSKNSARRPITPVRRYTR